MVLAIEHSAGTVTPYKYFLANLTQYLDAVAALNSRKERAFIGQSYTRITSRKNIGCPFPRNRGYRRCQTSMTTVQYSLTWADLQAPDAYLFYSA
ncbi:hypothetical protein SERLA73DRAFT_184159 [Serpula lacrymans var. lacrymans S7.3]|uniref:Uncharacterized protein n=2 Tax=Serpula lacrymans var. lacrymans TaxID=341189 RepID=F8Q2N9_SERL3|nr:uncharacterized protein SERLADRAFT_471702 [Serpula lacrymans var. lacrymans S7.9]EGN97450.1 hypothetical protein SERLA73DRAFT_184159 [Serpula lacrymans var. lacrymans S7.3]EGO23042.1 hypothetical protein SERLADRAFT_471702 [Serpula lacrymans var. lacrymans S7.9]